MAVTLKIKCNDELHRVLIDKEKLNFESVVESVKGIHNAGNTIVIKYLDEDQDLCTLCPVSFSDFLSHATEHNGKKVLKVEVFDDPGATISPSQPTMNTQADAPNVEPPAAQKQADAASPEPPANSACRQDHPLAALLHMGMQFMKGFGKGGHGWHHGWHHGYHHAPHHFSEEHHPHPFGMMKMFKLSLAQLHKNNLLDAESFSALFVTLLPQLATVVAEKPERINWKLDGVLQNIPSLFEVLHALVATTEGLQHCRPVIESWRDWQITTSEALLQVLPAVMALSFDAQLTFVKELYESQEKTLKERLQKRLEHHSWMPTVSLLHTCITCDGCNASPIAGIRFKCTSRPDYDLCTACFTKKSTLHGGDCKEDTFEAMTFPGSVAQVWAALKGKGKGQCKGKGKGKGKGKCWWAGEHAEQQEPRRCAREGCEFMATWHATHCCGSCARGEAHGHGRCCEKMVFPEAFVDQATVPVKDDAAMAVCPDDKEIEKIDNGLDKCDDDPKKQDDDDEHKTHEPSNSKDTDVAKDVDDSVASVEKIDKQVDDKDQELLKTATHLAEAGLGHVDVLMALLKANEGSVQRTLEELLNEA